MERLTKENLGIGSFITGLIAVEMWSPSIAIKALILVPLLIIAIASKAD